MDPRRPLMDAVPVAFRDGPLHRQVHAWNRGDVEATEAVRLAERPQGAYLRSSRWRRQIREHRPVTFSWKVVGEEADDQMPVLTVPPDLEPTN